MLRVTFPAQYGAVAKSEALRAIPGVRVLPGVYGGPRRLVCPLAEAPALQRALRLGLAGTRFTLKAPSPSAQATMDYELPVSASSAEALLQESLNAPLRESLYPYQLDGVRFGLRHAGKFLLADEMGLGKSIQALCTAICYYDEWPLLIVCPRQLCAGWRDEIRKWVPQALGSNAPPVQVCETLREQPERDGVVILSFDCATHWADELARFRVIIVDECHALKTHTSQRSKALLPLLKKAPRAICLSGTPIISRPAEAHALAHALRPRIIGAKRPFEERYCAAHQRFGRWEARGCSNSKELAAILSHTMMLCRRKDQVIQQLLPPKVREVQWIDVPAAAHIWEHHTLKASTNHSRSSSHTSLANNADLNAVYTESGPLKASVVAERVDALLRASQQAKVLVFAHHRLVLDELQRLLAPDWEYIRLDGAEPPTSRHALVQRFQRDASLRVAILSIKVAGVGITLTAANTVVFAELPWNSSDLLQAEDRAHRISQTQTVRVLYILARGSIDELLWNVIKTKVGVTSTTVTGKRAALQSSVVGGAGAAAAAAAGAAQRMNPLVTYFRRDEPRGGGAPPLPSTPRPTVGAAPAPATSASHGTAAEAQVRSTHQPQQVAVDLSQSPQKPRAQPRAAQHTSRVVERERVVERTHLPVPLPPPRPASSLLQHPAECKGAEWSPSRTVHPSAFGPAVSSHVETQWSSTWKRQRTAPLPPPPPTLLVPRCGVDSRSRAASAVHSSEACADAAGWASAVSAASAAPHTPSRPLIVNLLDDLDSSHE